jgi:hypothetical protein
LAKHPLGVRVWGCTGIGVQQDLVMMAPHANAAEYQAAVLDNQLEGQANAQYDVNNWFLMQDGASVHTSMPTIEAMGSHMNILPGWPPNSPDLNPIEMFCAIIDRRLAGRDSHAEKELGGRGEAHLGRSRTGVDRWPRGVVPQPLELCLACNGASISQLLSSHGMGPRPRDLADVGGFPAFAAEVDAANREWVGSHGSKWTKLREHLQSEGISLGDFPLVVTEEP